MKREYDGSPLDMTWQDIKDRPYKGEGETIYATSKGNKGTETTVGEPKIPKDITEEDVLALLEWALEVSKHSEEAMLPSHPYGDEYTQSELDAYRLGRFLVAEGVYDMIKELTGLDIGDVEEL